MFIFLQEHLQVLFKAVYLFIDFPRLETICSLSIKSEALSGWLPFEVHVVEETGCVLQAV